MVQEITPRDRSTIGGVATAAGSGVQGGLGGGARGLLIGALLPATIIGGLTALGVAALTASVPVIALGGIVAGLVALPFTAPLGALVGGGTGLLGGTSRGIREGNLQVAREQGAMNMLRAQEVQANVVNNALVTQQQGLQTRALEAQAMIAAAMQPRTNDVAPTTMAQMNDAVNDGMVKEPSQRAVEA